ncbi:MAG: UDP-3-O-acyl-N-acetylglucosamine deacetylase, partial [Armatimonadota bacterium]
MTSFPRNTVASSVSLSGKGLHSGEPVKVTVHPGQKGIRFMHKNATFDAVPENVTETRRCTKLGTVSTVEHLMSALWGLGFTDADVEVEGSEMPGLDGSSMGFVELLLSAGTAKCGHLEVEGPFARVYHVDGEAKVSVGTGDGLWRYDFDLEEMDLGWQHSEVVLAPESYAQEISPARTTVFSHELPHLVKMGLGRGLTGDDVVVIQKGGYENAVRFEDEPAR